LTAKWVRIASVATLVGEKSDGSSMPHIDLEDMESGTGRLLDTGLNSEAQTQAVIHRAGDVLFSKLRPYLAKSYLAIAPGSATGEILTMRPTASLDSRYFLYVTLSDLWLDWATSTSYGSKMPRSSWQIMRELQIPLPELDEQRRIADFLDKQTALIDLLRQKSERLISVGDDWFRSVVWSQITGTEEVDQRSSDLPWADTLPSHWGTVKISYVARLGTGHTPSRSRPEWWVDATTPWITTGEVAQFRRDQVEAIFDTRENISDLGLENSSAVLHPKGTVVLCRTASAGYSAIMGVDMATSQDFVTWTCGPELDPAFLLWCLRAMRRDLLGRLAQGSTHKTIYFPDAQSLKIPLPPLDEQRRIVDRIRAARSHSLLAEDASTRMNALLAEKRLALITEAVTGRLDMSTDRTVAA
jgi:type I restriction enzyme S subunit